MTDQTIDAQIVNARDPDTGEVVECVVVPEGHYLCVISASYAAQYADWAEAKAVRIKVEGDLLATFDITTDLDWVTSPEADAVTARSRWSSCPAACASSSTATTRSSRTSVRRLAAAC